MLKEHTVAAAAAAAGLTAPVHWSDQTGSTNTDLWALAEAGAPEWSLMAAGRQLEGRGRLGRTWVSMPGSSLHLSVLLRPVGPPAESAIVTLAAGVAMAGACEAAGVGVGCKWPNDLVARGSERKLGGVLAEASITQAGLDFVVLGIGVNVTQRERDVPPELRDAATSLVREGGAPNEAVLIRRFLEALGSLYGEGGRGMAERTLGPYRERCLTLARRVRATTRDGRDVSGVAVAIGRGGELIVQTDRGQEAVGFGEVQHLR
jgi:BirA family transcriptional regulator, biotin operon repressor / biotin---[acetyl-CoA-carboxylase] ligase